MTDPSKASARPTDTLWMERLFHNTPDDICRAILGAAPPIHLKKNRRLFEQGDSGGTMYVIQSGRIEISVLTEQGRKISFDLIGSGQCFGEISMVDNGARTASALALEDTILQPISRAIFLEGVTRCPSLAVNLLVILCERLRFASGSVEEYALLPLHRRLARRLLLLHENFARPDGSIEIAQSDLADFAGATRESTNKILMQWKSAGLITLKRGNIHLRDMEELDHLAYGEEA